MVCSMDAVLGVRFALYTFCLSVTSHCAARGNYFCEVANKSPIVKLHNAVSLESV